MIGIHEMDQLVSCDSLATYKLCIIFPDKLNNEMLPENMKKDNYFS